MLSTLAVTNHDFISLNEERLKEFIREGGSIRYILVDPDGDAVKMFGPGPDSAERYLGYICLEIVSRRAKLGRPGSVEIKLIDHLPSAMITMLDHQPEVVSSLLLCAVLMSPSFHGQALFCIKIGMERSLNSIKLPLTIYGIGNAPSRCLG